MTNKEIAINYLNYFSRLLVIIETFPYPINQLFALHNFKDIEENVFEEFEVSWKKGYEIFLSELSMKVTELEASSEQDKYVIAYQLCCCLDKRIIYADDYSDLGKISLYDLLQVSENIPCTLVEPMNDNFSKTYIAIHPKFKVYDVHEHYQNDKGEEKTITRSTSIKDAFSKINGYLDNISYTKYDDSDLSVVDIVINGTNLSKKDYLTIAFSPMTDQDYLDEKDELVCLDGISFNATAVLGVKSEQQENMLQRFDDAWIAASNQGTDIIFFPEAMGLPTLENVQNGQHMHIKKLGEIVMENGGQPPTITFLPSYCADKTNSISIAYQDGRHLGKQYKHRPFVNRKTNRMETIITKGSPTIVVIHIPGVHRVAIMICSDYLTCPVETQQKLFADLGITLLLVPSFSKGEQDFISKLPELKKYGTTVVWGNCCAATEPERIRGGCSIATLDTVNRFNECDECKNECKKGCLYLVRIPIHTKRAQRQKVILDDVIKHKLL